LWRTYYLAWEERALRGHMSETSAGTERTTWPLASAAAAVDELIHLLGERPPAGWAFAPATHVDDVQLDLRGTAELDVVPIVLPDGNAVGTVRCPVRPTGDPTDAALRVLLQAVVLLVAMERRGFAAVNRATEAERESRMDPLTALPNRRVWDAAANREQARCNRYGLQALVAVVDLDDLKDVNDHQGHLAGDVLLRVAGQALRSAVREVDLVTRLGGDEFAILAVEFDDGDVNGFLDRIRAALDDAGVAASVGVAVADRTLSIAEAFEHADRAMYADKHERKGVDTEVRGGAV
jgi:diguanylate cyclase (GGDEF)-like protein